MRRTALALLAAAVVTACTAGAQALHLSGEFGGTHDPSIAKEGNTYYVFATGAAYPSHSAEADCRPPTSPR